MYNNSVNQDLLNQINQLWQQVISLQVLIEQLQYDNVQFKQFVQDQYLDLDSCLNWLEGGNVVLVLLFVLVSVLKVVLVLVKFVVVVIFEWLFFVYGDVGSFVVIGDECIFYNVVFDVLKVGRYDDLVQLFLSFLELYLNGVYVLNVLYWLGESYYVICNFLMVEIQF